MIVTAATTVQHLRCMLDFIPISINMITVVHFCTVDTLTVTQLLLLFNINASRSPATNCLCASWCCTGGCILKTRVNQIQNMAGYFIETEMSSYNYLISIGY